MTFEQVEVKKRFWCKIRKLKLVKFQSLFSFSEHELYFVFLVSFRLIHALSR